MKPLRILLTNQDLNGRSGGGLYVRDLAAGLLRLGHRPVIYCGRLGELAEEIRQQTIPVINRLDLLTDTPDVIHGNSPVETVAALMQFPKTPAVFTCHGWISIDAKPPRFQRILRYIAVDETCQDRLVCEEGIPVDRVSVEYNAVDLEKFPLRGKLPPQPQRALVFSNNASDSNYTRTLRAACAKLNIEVDVVGQASGHACQDPGEILGGYDLVFAKARAALEAMACGTAVILCDARGMGQMVTVSDLDHLRSRNFGWRALHNPIDEARLIHEIQRFDPLDATLVSEKIRRNEGLALRVASMVSIYRAVIHEYSGLSIPNANAQMKEVADYLQLLAPITNTFHARSLKAKTDGLETQVTAPLEMHPLSPQAQEQIRLELRTNVASARTNETLEFDVQLENCSDQLVGSFPPNPLNLSYRWLNATTHEAISCKSIRTKIAPALQPDAKRLYTITCQTPRQPGSYILRVTMLQEGVKWFDRDGPDLAQDVEVTIG